MTNIAQERLITNKLMLNHLDMWDEFDIKSVDDTQTVRYYNRIMNHINDQLDAGVKWLDSDEAEKYFKEESQYHQKVFQSLEDEWDSILEGKYPSVEALLDEVYRRGKAQGYTDMREHVRYTEADKQALRIATEYNYHLINKIDNDVRNEIKNKIISGFLAGDNPNVIAPKIQAIAGEQLEGSTFTPRQRATMITKTEISRVQNTGMLQSYINEGYTEVKILTAEDNNVCATCLEYAYEFNKDDDLIYENAGKEKIHNIIELIKGEKFPPFHPLCRCTYLLVWESKGKPPEKPYVIDLTRDFHELEGLFYSTMFDENCEISDEQLPSLNEKIFKEQIKGFVDESDINSITDFLNKFINELPNVHREFGAAKLFGGINIGFGDWKNKIKIPNIIQKFGLKYNIPILIHNHPYNRSPFPSSKDFNSYAKYGAKYGIVTNDLGTFLVKNNNITGNKKAYGEIEKPIMDIKLGMIEDFEKKYGYTFNEKDSVHVKNISKMVNENSEKYLRQYQNALSNFNMEVMFIKNEYYK